VTQSLHEGYPGILNKYVELCPSVWYIFNALLFICKEKTCDYLSLTLYRNYPECVFDYSMFVFNYLPCWRHVLLIFLTLRLISSCSPVELTVRSGAGLKELVQEWCKSWCRSGEVADLVASEVPVRVAVVELFQVAGAGTVSGCWCRSWHSSWCRSYSVVGAGAGAGACAVAGAEAVL
jgi:hypothetical protein